MDSTHPYNLLTDDGDTLNNLEATDCPYYLVSRCTLMITSALRRQFAAADLHDMRPAYLGVLWTLWKQDGLRVVDLARGAGLEPSTMTGLLDRMERAVLVKRQPDPNDRRALRIHLTDHGRAVEDTVRGIVATTMTQMFEGVEPAEVSRVEATLKTVLENSRRRV